MTRERYWVQSSICRSLNVLFFLLYEFFFSSFVWKLSHKNEAIAPLSFVSVKLRCVNLHRNVNTTRSDDRNQLCCARLKTYNKWTIDSRYTPACLSSLTLTGHTDLANLQQLHSFTFNVTRFFPYALTRSHDQVFHRSSFIRL